MLGLPSLLIMDPFVCSVYDYDQCFLALFNQFPFFFVNCSIKGRCVSTKIGDFNTVQVQSDRLYCEMTNLDLLNQVVT